MMKTKWTLAAAAAVSMALLGTACSSTDSSSTSAQSSDTGSSEITIGYVPTTGTNPFWQAVRSGLEEATNAAGVQLVDVDPQADQDKMNTQIGDLLASGVDALVVAPYDTTGIKAALEAAADANVPVINIDTPVADQDLVASIVASDNEKAGELVAQDMMSKLERGSKVAVLHCPQGQACIDRLNGFNKTQGDYFEIVNTLDGKGELASGMSLTDDLLQSDPDIKAIFGINDPMALGAVQSLAAHPDVTGVLVYGVDGSPDAKAAISAGTMTGTGAQSPITMGRTAGEVALSVIKGETVDKQVVVDVSLITADNIADYSLDAWQ